MHIERMNGHFVKIHTSDGVLHHFSGADGPDAWFHDHPFSADITVLVGGYVEQVLDPANPLEPVTIERHEGDTFRNDAGTIHRILHLTSPFCITEFRPGPHERKPGFYEVRDGVVWQRRWDEPYFTPLEGLIV